MKPFYFDHNATTPLCDAARHAWLEAIEDQWLNPSSPYRAAASVRVRYEKAREELAEMFGICAERVTFNSGATEGNNTVFYHWAQTLPRLGSVGVSPTEHPSVIEAAEQHFSGRIHWLELDSVGAVDLDALEAKLSANQLLAVSAMAANNETGVLNDWKAIAEHCRQASIPYHCDASQWIGKLPLNGLSAATFVTGCAHKFGGTRGAGFLIQADPQALTRLFSGGAHEYGRRAGTEDVAGVMAMVAALKQSVQLSALGRDQFIESLKFGKLVGSQAERLPNTVCLLMPEFKNTRWVRAIERRGYLVSSGAACAAGKNVPSHVLAAIGYERDQSERSLRISSGSGTTEADWLALCDALAAAYAELRDEAAGSNSRVISI